MILIIFLVSFSIVCRGIDWRTYRGKKFYERERIRARAGDAMYLKNTIAV